MTTRRFWAATLASVFLSNIGGVSSAYAQTKCSVSDPLYPGAKMHFENGIKLEAQAVGGEKNAHFLVEARDEFLIAYRTCPLRTAAINLAVLELSLTNPLKAMEYLRDVVRINGGPMKVDAETSAAAAERYKRAFDEAYASTAHAKIDAPTDAVIFVDGQQHRFHAPLAEPVDLPPGPHTFEARLGGQTKSQRVELLAGQDTAVALALGDAPATARLDLDVHQTNAKPYVVAGLAAVGTLGAAGGLFFAARAGSQSAEADGIRATLGANAACPSASSAECSRLADLRSDKGRNSTVGIVSVVGGGAFLGAALVTALLWKPAKESSKTAIVSPVFGPAQLGIDVSARF